MHSHWNILDDNNNAYATATVNCRVAISNAQQFNEVFRLRVNLPGDNKMPVGL